MQPVEYIDRRSGERVRESVMGDGALRFAYETLAGRTLWPLLFGAKFCSAVMGWRYDSPRSRSSIAALAAIPGCRADEAEKPISEYASFNEFFTRRIKSENRPIDMTPEAYTAPCDGLLSVYPIENGTVVPVKQSRYTIADLLGSEEKAKLFEGGTCLVFRLCVDHYHRYAYNDDCEVSTPYFIKGKLHTVRPIALEKVRVFTTNCREVTLMETDNFGTIAQIEVGAMLVGKIKNHEKTGRAKRGEEKGMFLYGGSTVIQLVQAGRVDLEEDFFRNTHEYFETPVVWGERLGTTHNDLKEAKL